MGWGVAAAEGGDGVGSPNPPPRRVESTAQRLVHLKAPISTCSAQDEGAQQNESAVEGKSRHGSESPQLRGVGNPPPLQWGGGSSPSQGRGDDSPLRAGRTGPHSLITSPYESSQGGGSDSSSGGSSGSGGGPSFRPVYAVPAAPIVGFGNGPPVVDSTAGKQGFGGGVPSSEDGSAAPSNGTSMNGARVQRRGEGDAILPAHARQRRSGAASLLRPGPHHRRGQPALRSARASQCDPSTGSSASSSLPTPAGDCHVLLNEEALYIPPAEPGAGKVRPWRTCH